MTGRPVFAELPDALIARADEVCDRFEAAWRAGDRPRIEDLLTGFDGPARAELVVELLHLEVACRRLQGETPAPDEYADRFPELATDHLARVVAQPTAGRRIGRFELLELIGAGGFGAVWRARDVDLDRTVAVKLPHPGLLDSPAALGRFRREARAAARLRHPGVAAVHDAGVVDGVPVLVTDFIPGVSLRDLLRARRPTFREAAAIVAAAADALDYTHQMGSLHRDVKPANIIIADDPETPAGQLGRPVLVDFGLARVGADGSLTLDGQVFGTPAYMSPEQAAGTGRRTDARTDVYGLGAVLYELLTGRAPFVGSGSAILQQLLREAPRPPRRVDPAVPRDLATVCLKAIAREPHRRYPRAADLADDLRRWLRREPIRARPVGPVGRGLAWARRRPTAAGLVFAVGAAVLASAALFLSAADGTRLRAAHQAEAEQRKRAEGDLYFHRVALAGRALDENNVAQTERLLAECPESHRGWEWYYLKGQCRGGRLALSLSQAEGSGWSVRGVAYSGDGSRLAATDGRGLALVWDPETGREVGRVADNRATFGLAFARDGRHLAVVGDGGATVWDLDGSPSHTLRGDLVRGLAVAYSPDDQLIATGESVIDPPPVDTAPRRVRVWNAATGQLLRVLDGPTQDILGLAFRPGSRQLAAVTGAARPGTVPTRPGVVKVWATDTGREVFTAAAGAPLTGVAYSRDGRRLAAGGLNRTVTIWDANSGREETILRRYAQAVLGVAWGSGGQLATAGEDGLVKVWDVDANREVVTLRGHTGPVAGVAFRPDGKQLASAGWDQTVRIWDPARDQPVTTLRGHTGPVADLTVLPDGRIASTANPDRPGENSCPEVLVWNPSAPDDPLRLPTVAGLSAGVAASANGRQLVASIDRRIHTWDIATGRESPAGAEFEERVSGVAILPDGREVAAAVTRRAVALRDTVSGADRLLRGGLCLFRVAVSPDGRWLVAPTGHYNVSLWHLPTGREEASFRAHARLVADVAFGPGGRSFATASWDGTAKIWDTAAAGRGEAAALRLTLRGHAEPVLTVGFSPDGQRLATGSEDQRIKIWDTATGQEVLTLRGHSGAVTRVAFSPDGRRVVSGSRDGTLKVWEAAGP